MNFDLLKRSALKGLSTNQTGEIMIIGYHEIGKSESRWQRTPGNFRQDLQTLYENDYYPISLLGYVHNIIKTPLGKTPVIFTFDDSSPGQFQLFKSNGSWKIAPDCAVGVMEAFRKEHPDFPVSATFYANPEAAPAFAFFGQPDLIDYKLKYLTENGYEIGNHGFTHPDLSKCSDAEAQRQLALGYVAVSKYIPGYFPKTLALPYGKYSKNKQLAQTGKFEGITYQHEAVLYCGSGPAPAPGTKKFNPFELPRVLAGDGSYRMQHFLKVFAKYPGRRYVSEGEHTELKFE